ncbi:hypothetical protein, partial [Streptomyces muensis]
APRRPERRTTRTSHPSRTSCAPWSCAADRPRHQVRQYAARLKEQEQAMPTDHYAVLRALLRAEAVRNTPKPQSKKEKPQHPPKERERG